MRREEALLYGTARPGEIKTEGGGGGGGGGMGGLRFATIDRNKTYSPIPAGRGRPGGTGGEYTHIWEVRRPPHVLLPSGVDDPHHHHLHHHPSCHHHHTLDGRGPGRPVPACIGTLTKGDHLLLQGSPPPGPPHQQQQDAPNNGSPADGATLRRDAKARASFTTFKPQRDEHIYQSPKLDRKARTNSDQQPPHTCSHGPCGAADAPFYFELDPKQGSKLVALNSTCTLPRSAAGGDQQPFHNSSC